MHALARLMLGASFRNLQASWVKDGIALAGRLLRAGVNDLGGTLINESISTSAGSAHGQLVPPGELRRLIRAKGRVPAERTSLYALRNVYRSEADDAPSPLDAIDDAAARFGSYEKLAKGADFRFRAADKERWS